MNWADEAPQSLTYVHSIIIPSLSEMSLNWEEYLKRTDTMRSTKRVWLVLLAFVCAALTGLSPSAFAMDRSGHYFIGGGVGAVSCADFLDLMARARVAGGLTPLPEPNSPPAM